MESLVHYRWSRGVYLLPLTKQPRSRGSAFMAHNSTVHIVIATDEKPVAFADKYVGRYDNPAGAINKLFDFLGKVISCTVNSKVFLFVDKGDGTAATGTVVCTQASAVQGDTFTLAGVVFTVKTTPSTRPDLGEFAAGASDTAMGDNLAAAVNAHPALKGMLTMANAAGTCTWTLEDKGVQGNLARATETGDSMAVTNPTNGAIGTVQSAFRIFRRGK